MTLSRRVALGGGLGLLAGGGLLAAAGPALAAVEALQQAHAAVGQARAAYHLILESGKLPVRALDLAERLYARHRAAEEALADRLRRARPAAPAPARLERPDVEAALGAARSPADMLRLMRDVELQILAALVAQRSIDPEVNLLLVAAAADTAMHWTLLNSALGEPLPAPGLLAGGSLPLSESL